MRKAICGLLFTGALAFAQATPALDADAERAKAMADAFKQKLEHMNFMNPAGPRPFRLQNPPALRPSVCAIPLLRVIPPGTADKMTVVQPRESVRESGDTVKVPAPACDEKLSTNGPPIVPAPPPAAPQPPKP